MPHIPAGVKDLSVVQSLRPFLKFQGKVRDIYELPKFPGCQVVVASNRLSAFDQVFNLEVPGKGEVLTAMTHFWLSGPLRHIPNQLYGSPGNPFDGMGLLRELMIAHPDLPAGRTLVVKKFKMLDFEMVFRMHLGGSVWKKYLAGKPICGQVLPPGLAKWSKFDYPLFTPTTKSSGGHDEDVDVADFYEATGEFGRTLVRTLTGMYSTAYEYGLQRGFVILDTKFETSEDGRLGDELLTPDSSRMCRDQDLIPGTDPPTWDKEPIRKFCISVITPFFEGTEQLTLDKLSPGNFEHQKFVDGFKFPPKVIADATERYRAIAEAFFNMSLSRYQRNAKLI